MYGHEDCYVGGIEAEAFMLGQPVTFLVPEVVGVHMTGELREGVTATDLALHVTQMLSNKIMPASPRAATTCTSTEKNS